MYCFLISSRSKFTECKYPCSNTVQNEHLRGCDQCQQFKLAPHLRTDPLSIVVPEGPWQVISMDLVTGLPKSEGLDRNKYNAIATYVDLHSKVAHFILTTKQVNIEGIANIHEREIF